MDATRRDVWQGAAAAAGALLLGAGPSGAAMPAMRAIPSTGDQLPLVGLGSWITFNVGRDAKLRDESVAVMQAFFDGGGRLIDSSPMYGSAPATIGYGLAKLHHPKQLFSAEKVWISDAASGPRQIKKSLSDWGLPAFDLLQIHNLVSWEQHLEMLRSMKQAGRLRYIGITTSHGRRHADLARIMQSERLDFIQLTYNIADREAEQRLLPIARERGIAVIVNRPFQGGDLIERLARRHLPPWVAEIGAATWAQFLLRFVISHPAVTCAIPATTRVDHVRENLAAATAVMPDQALRQRMASYVRQL